MNLNKNPVTNMLKKPNSNSTLTKQATNIGQKAMNKGEEVKNKIQNIAQTTSNTIKEKVTNVQKKITDVTDKPEIKVPLSKWTAMTQDFLAANTAISKFVSFILMLLLFLILFQLGTGLLQYMFGVQYNPYILNGMVPSSILTVVSANPNMKNSVPIYRSVDAPQGIEYTWNVWFIVQKKTIIGKNYLIFSKGKNSSNRSTATQNGLIASVDKDYINVSPGLFLSETTNLNKTTQENSTQNKLLLVTNTYDPKIPNSNWYETIEIPNIPMQKWVCCTIRVQGTYVDIYINGVLNQRKILNNPPKQNYYDTYIGDTEGFGGYISSLRYYAHAINYDEIQSLFAAGPNLTLVSSATMPASNDYLAMSWYYNYNNTPTTTST